MIKEKHQDDLNIGSVSLDVGKETPFRFLLLLDYFPLSNVDTIRRYCAHA